MRPVIHSLKSLYLLLILLLGLLGFAQKVSSEDRVTLRVMTFSSELTADQIASFEAANPDIQIELLDWDEYSIVVDLSIASEDLPDVIRLDASYVKDFVNQGLIQDITPYIERGERIQLNDLSPVNNYYRIDNRYYGIVEDWSPGFSLWVVNSAFEKAGIPIPSTTEPLTYAEIAELAQRLTVRDGTNVTQYGFYSFFTERMITSILAQRGISMFNDDFSEMHLTDNTEALETVHFVYNMMLNDSMYPAAENVEADAATKNGQVAIFQLGYWLGSTVTPASPLYNDVTMLPAPTWNRDLPRINPTKGPVGLAISSLTPYPDEAYRFIEWYIAGEGGIERAKTGWGVPALNSMIDLLPQETPLDQQRFDVLQGEIPFSDWILPMYPYRTIRVTFNNAWNDNIQKARQGSIDFDTFASNLEEEVNLAILTETLDN